VRKLDLSHFSRQDLLPWLSGTPGRQHYAPNAFRRFNLTLHWHEEFSIQIYFMDDISTEIHTHSFYGLYQYLEGTSHQSLFNEKPVAPYGL
jgi:hypothetical protein